MDNNMIEDKNQITDSNQLGIFKHYFNQFKVGTLLNRSGIIKTKGLSPLCIFSILFNLAFVRKNLYEGVVKNKKVVMEKDVAYNFLNSPTYNWRRFTLLLFSRIYVVISNLLDNSSEEVLVLDDSPYDRSRSKKVELLSRVYDHSTKKYIKGFRMLTLGWSDGNSFLGIDFALLSSAKEKNRYNEISSKIDKRTCGYKRRQEAIMKSTEIIEPMIKRALDIGVRVKHIVMDSWFSMPCLISLISKHIHVICMMKDNPTWKYIYDGKNLRVSDIYKKLKKKRGKAKIKASVLVRLPNGEKVKIIFVPGDKQRGWLALLSTDLTPPDEEIVRLYGKRWDIEVFFKMCKQHLKLVKEIQIRNYDGLIGHTSMVLARYNILSLFQRQHIDQRFFGDLFRACNEEMVNISFFEALKRIMQLAIAGLHRAYALSEEIIQ